MRLASSGLSFVRSWSLRPLHLFRIVKNKAGKDFVYAYTRCAILKTGGIHADRKSLVRWADYKTTRSTRWVANKASTKCMMVSVELNDVESLLRRLLLDVAAYIDHDPPLELRFTGGWVRDKLLGVDSHDIDVAINAMTGYQFGLKMKEYLDAPGNLEKYSLEATNGGNGSVDKAKKVHGLHKIAANPDKSKHLETVTTKIFGLDIDLVNLRKETYSDDSRNPQMEFGTPTEDALRRDATINAMFYNLSTETVEDLTNRGLEDMASQLIRTPLEPYQTFKDDPLRVLRLIRFASRLNYNIVPEVEESMMEKSIKEALEAKISRERIGVEFEKMLRGPYPLSAFQLIDRLGLYNTIFADPTTDHKFLPDLDRFGPSYQVANALLLQVAHEEVLQNLIQTTEDVYMTWLLSAIIPYVDAPLSDHAKKIPLAASVAREGIKATNKVSDIVISSVRNLRDITSVVDQCIRCKRNLSKPDANGDAAGRDTLGMAIRRWGPTWRNQMVFAMLVEATNTPIPSEAFLESTRDRLQAYLLFLNELRSLNLLDAYNMRPLIDGKTLAKALSTKPGPWMKDALDVVMAWQLRNPKSTDVEEAISMIKTKQSQGELTKALRYHFLKLTIRPLFAKTQTPNITTAGRKVITQNLVQRRYEAIEDETVTRPWKGDQGLPALDLLVWVVGSLDQKSTEENWPLLLPPLLTLVDDTDIKYKVLGCKLLTMLLTATSPLFLARTGLSGVLQDAIRPCLSYLPTLTPDTDSVDILNAAYPAMLKVLQTSSDQSIVSQKVAKLLHEKILPSISHCSGHPRVVTAILHNLILTVRCLRIDTVAHLQFLIPVHSALLAQPFGATYPELIAAAALTMREVLLCAWPRAMRWRGEVLKGLVGAWLEVTGEEKRWSRGNGDSMLERIRATKTELQRCSAVLIHACELAEGTAKGVATVETEVKQIVDADPALKGLFQASEVIE